MEIMRHLTACNISHTGTRGGYLPQPPTPNSQPPNPLVQDGLRPVATCYILLFTRVVLSREHVSMKYCALLACANRNFKNEKTSGVRHHKFPADDVLREEWISFVNKYNRSSGWTTVASRGAALCEAHFEKEFHLPNKKLSKTAIPTIAPKFTAEVAHKFGLIPIVHSPLLEKLNDFDNPYHPGSEDQDCDFPDPPSVETVCLDMPMSPLQETHGAHSNSNAGWATQVVHVQFPEEDKENEAPTPDLMQWDSQVACDKEEPLLKQDSDVLSNPASSFDSLKMNTGSPRVASTPLKPRKRKLHVGDLSASDFNTPAKAKQSLRLVKERHSFLTRKAKIYYQRWNRAKLRIKSLESLVKVLEQKKLIQG